MRVIRFGLVMLAAAGASAVVLAQTTVLEVIALKYRTAEQVIPILQPLLAREGSLGEWIEIGSLNQRRSEQRSEILGSSSRSGAENRRVLIKVEELK